MMRTNLRTVRKEDEELVRTLLRETRLPGVDLDGSDSAFFIAESRGKEVGIAGFEFYGHDALLRSVAVSPEMQGRGLGSQIVELMLDEARRRKVRSVVLLTETAKDFFVKKGFTVVERSAVANEAMKNSSEFTDVCPTSAVCMRILL